MGVKRRMVEVAAGAAGVAVAGAAVRAVQQRRVVRHRNLGDTVPLGSLRSSPITVIADDGVPLHVEVDEFDPEHDGNRRRRKPLEKPPVTVVFVHGYSLNLDCWHFQRAGFRGAVRTVYYDQRSHGRSGRSEPDNSTIEQLGRDLVRVLESVTHDEPVVVVGHSMGGMTLMALAEEQPELFGTKIAGVALISTTAGGLDPGRILFPMLPAGLGGGVMGRVVRTLSRGSRAVDRLRGAGHDLALVVADAYAFGEDVPTNYIEFVYDMLDRTPFAVVADFFPAFASLDKWKASPALSAIPTAIICGTNDKMTAIGHSRKLHASIHGSDLLECVGAGHMVILERHEQVNDELDHLIQKAVDRVEAGG